MSINPAFALSNLNIIIKWYLKYKDTQTISKTKAEEVKPDIEKPIDAKVLSRKPNKKLIILFSGLFLIVATVNEIYNLLTSALMNFISSF